jgi:hypothetical protein
VSPYILLAEVANGRTSRLGEFAPAELDRAAALLAVALARERPPARVAPADPFALVPISSAARGMRATLQRDGLPVAEVAIATHARAGAQLWRALHREHGGRIKGDAAQAPAAPWCAFVPLGSGAGADEVETEALRLAGAIAAAFVSGSRP